MRKIRWLMAICLALAFAPVSLLAQGAATITGRVTSEAGAPVPTAAVRINALSIGTVTGEDGSYRLTIPAARLQGGQQVQVTASRVGFQSQSRTVTLSPGASLTQNFQLAATALELEGIVATGVSGGAMERAKVPFSVSRVDVSQMPVQASNPLTQLQGKVPGANIGLTSGRPGRAPEVILRGPTSINGFGRGQGPLIIVDGIVLGSSLADINPADIESVEIVKGAAASTLYGSRAASGVIQITTRRGATGAQGVNFTARSEVGFNDIERDFGIARNHPFLLDETGTRFCALDPYGSANVCSRTVDYRSEVNRINNHPGAVALGTVSFPVDPGAVTTGPILQRSFLAGHWPGTTYNAVEQLVDPKPRLTNDVSIAGRVGSTTLFSSLGHVREGGAIMGLEGYERLQGRVNLGHRFGDNWSVDVNTYVSRSTEDGANQDEGGTGFFRLTRTPAVVDITQRDDLGRLFIRTNLGSAGTQNENPLYSFENVDRDDRRWRTLGGATVRYTPSTWFESDATFNIDRLNYDYLEFQDRGFRTTNANPATNEGLIFNGSWNTTSINTGAGILLRPDLASWVSPRITLRMGYEQQESDLREVQGQFLRVAGVRAAQNATQQQVIRSSATEVQQLSFSAGTFLDILDRYTFDFAVRHDGNSNFGEEERWQTYGRASGAWLLAREAWFPSDVLSTFTLRASYGTAGNAPNFFARHEAFTIASGGVLSAATLGNPNLRPEVMKEMELGADVELFGRVGLSVTYANSITENQILPVPVPVATGFPQQWQNAGDLRNRTWEASLDLPIVRDRPFTWSTRLNYATTRTTIEKLNVPAFFMGTNLQATETIIRVAEGLPLGTIWGRQFITECGQLPANFRQQCGGEGSAYQRNADGYIVWVGQGNNTGMGITHNLWNAILPAAQSPWGVQTAWGMPMIVRDSLGVPLLGSLGETLPDSRLGMSHTVGYGKFSLYGLVEGVFGRSVWNQGLHWSYLDFLSSRVDQQGRSVQDAKPIGYYYRAGPGLGNGAGTGVGGFYDILGPNNETVEDASFVKLREVSLGYNIGPVAGFGDWTLNVVGRNLKTWTDYRGFDPEVGVGNAGVRRPLTSGNVAAGYQVQSDAGSAMLNAVDAFGFPQVRTVSFVLQTTF